MSSNEINDKNWLKKLKMHLNKIKNKVSELIQVSTAYGLPNVYRSKRLFNKSFWLFFLVISFMGASYYIYNDIVDYFNYEVVTTVKTEYDQPTEFPTISFCSLNSLNNSILNYEYVFDGDKTVEENPNNHFESFNSSKYGRCFRFNSGKNMNNQSIPIKYSNSGGLFDAFSLEAFDTKGLVFWIHNKSTVPSAERDVIKVRTNSSYYIELERTFESKLEEPFNNCLKDPSTFKKNKTLIDFFLKYNQLYSQERCFDLCFDLFYINENQCKCREAELGNVLTHCWENAEAHNYSGCTWIYRTKFLNNSLVEKCSHYCPLECDHVSFFLTIKDNERMENSKVQIIVFYKTLKYTAIIQQAKMKPEQLISNLGGYLGLFVGLSFVSLFEIAELIFEIIFIITGKQSVVVEPITQHELKKVLRSEIELLRAEYEEKITLNNKKIEDICNKYLINK